MTPNYVNPWLLYWFATGSSGGRTRAGKVGGGTKASSLGADDFVGVVELEDLKKTLKSIEDRERLHDFEKANFSVATGRFFLPSTTLQIAAKRSLAVCRISRNFSLKEFQQEIKWMQELPEEYRKRYNKTAFKEIFSISDKIANQIFTTEENSLNELSNISEELLGTLNPIPWGTGFLVGGTQLLTNYHIIPTEEIAEQCIAQFNYVENIWGSADNSISYEFEPKALFACNPELDYTLVQLKSSLSKNPAGYNFGWIPLIEKDDNIAPGIIGISKTSEDLLPVIIEKIQELKQINKTGILKDSEDDQDNESKIYELKDEYELIEIETLFKDEVSFIYPSFKKTDLSGTVRRESKPVIITNWEELFQDINKSIDLIISTISSEFPVVQPQQLEIIKNITGEPVIIIQHPKGRKKEIILFENKVINNGLLKNYLRYSADADYGSSGSPVFNTRWELVALHHAAIPNYDSRVKASNAEKETIFAQQGVRICKIIEDLKQQSINNYKLKSFIEDFVITFEQINYPPLPSGLEFNGSDSYITVPNIVLASSTTNFEQSDDPKSVDKGFSTIKLWDEFGIELKTFVHNGVQRIQFSPDRKLLASAGGDLERNIILWSLEEDSFIRLVMPVSPNSNDDLSTNSEALASVTSLSFSYSGHKLLAVANKLNIVTIWDLENNNLLKAPFKEAGSSIVFSPDGKLLAIINKDKETIKFWDTQDWTVKITLSAQGISNPEYSFSSDSKIFVGRVGGNEYKLWNLNNNQEPSLLEGLEGYKGNILSAKFKTVEPNNLTVLMAICGDANDWFIRNWTLDGKTYDNPIKLSFADRAYRN